MAEMEHNVFCDYGGRRSPHPAHRRLTGNDVCQHATRTIFGRVSGVFRLVSGGRSKIENSEPNALVERLTSFRKAIGRVWQVFDERRTIGATNPSACSDGEAFEATIECSEAAHDV